MKQAVWLCGPVYAAAHWTRRRIHASAAGAPPTRRRRLSANVVHTLPLHCGPHPITYEAALEEAVTQAGICYAKVMEEVFLLTCAVHSLSFGSVFLCSLEFL